MASEPIPRPGGPLGGLRLCVAEVRAYPGRVTGVAVACALTAAGMGACLVLFAAVSGPSYPEGSAAAAAAADAQSLLGLLLTLLLMSAVLVTGSTVALWTNQRLGQFAVLRALGVTAGRLRALVVADVALVALAPAAVAAVAGTVPAAGFGRRVLIERELFPAAVELPSTGQTGAIAAGACLGTCAVAVLAALASVLAAGRVQPIDLLKEESLALAPPRRNAGRLVAGVAMALLLCGPLVVLMAATDMPPVFQGAMVMGLAMSVIPTLAVLAPWFVPLLTGPCCVLLRLLDRRAGRIAAAGLRAAPARTAAIAVPVLLAVGTVVCLLGSGATMGAAVHRQTGQALRADAVVTAEPGSRLPARPAGLPGGTAVAPIATEVTAPSGFYDDQPRPTQAWGVDGAALRSVLDLGEQQGGLTELVPGTFAAGSTQAASHHWKLGQSVGLRLADGQETQLRLVAVYQRDLAFPSFVLPADLALAHTPAPYADRVLLRGDPNTWELRPGQRLAARADYLAHLRPRSVQDDMASRLIVSVVGGYALLAVANTCAIAQRDRRSQRAHLRALGLGRGQLLRCVVYEVLASALVGAVLAVVTAGICLVPLARAVGQGPLPALDVPWTVGVLTGVLVATVVPAALAARPLRGIRRQFATGSS
ncbi:FtsX-like permease family protein [Streptomyces sp. CBMA156]|uniref:FtsX-like permease family protein n=1 Tax=Streptomyces sp. CBMA156 TaxID=1930280 RepID=UPI001661B6C9|nr:FtsX-like permease family protein [Streptomyces sp. CBMA156]